LGKGGEEGVVNDDEETERQGTTDAMEVESPRSGEKGDFVRKVVEERKLYLGLRLLRTGTTRERRRFGRDGLTEIHGREGGEESVGCRLMLK
jgi:hypothetical protein